MFKPYLYIQMLNDLWRARREVEKYRNNNNKMTKQEILEKIEELKKEVDKMADNGEWKPEEDDVVFVLWGGGNVEELRYNQIQNSKGCYCQGNVFRTRAEAEAIRDLREDMQRYDVRVGDIVFYFIKDNLIVDCFGYDRKICLTGVLQQIGFKTKEDAQRRADILNRLAKARGLI